jgi:hypothetical protein
MQNGLPRTGGHFRLMPVLVHVMSGSACWLYETL